MCDLRFLPQVLALYRSLERHAVDYRLRVLCMDEPSRRFLSRSRLAHLRTRSIAELEDLDPELAALRGKRTWTEYCWTATPAFCRLMVESAPPDDVVLWMDADTEFLRDPAALLDELGDGSVLLTPHHYYRTYPSEAPAWLLTERYGRFNGGTIALRNDREGVAAAGLWRSRSIEWCHERLEPGLFGNQLHLTDFPLRFPTARVLEVPGGGLGPWNAADYRISRDERGVYANGRPVVFYHHQSLRLYRRPVRLRAYGLPYNAFRIPGHGGALVGRTLARSRFSRAERRLIWRPYLNRLAQAVDDVAREVDAFPTTLHVLGLHHLRSDRAQRRRIARSRLNAGARRVVTLPRRAVSAGSRVAGSQEPERAQP
jgi:hypothetical protein